MFAPKGGNYVSLFIPSDEIEYIHWLSLKCNGLVFSELSHNDYVENLKTHVLSFEELFYHLDVSRFYIDPNNDHGEVIYPEVSLNLSLVEFRHNCNREYNSITDVIGTLTARFQTVYDKLEEIDDAELVYFKRRWSKLLSDIKNVYELILVREGML